MDERQTQIVEGAGLEESRLNKELLDFLNKWSFPALMIVAIVSGGYYVWQLMEQRRIAKRDEAFGQFAAVEGAASPSVFSLTEIADQFDGVGSVAELARLRAADVHLDAVRSGVDPAEPDKELTQEDRVYRLDQAESLYRRVYDAASAAKGKGLIAANAAFGLAAVAETRGDLDAAREQYGRAKTLAEQAGFAPLAEVADELIAGLDSLESQTLYSQDDLPRLPFMPEPEPETETGQGEDAVEGDLGVSPSLNLTPAPVPTPEATPADQPPAGDPPADEPPSDDPADG